MSLTYYKIRSKLNSNLYRKADGSWNTSGKVYDTLGKLRTTITNRMNNYSDRARAEVFDWEIVEFEVTVKEIKQLIDVIKPERVWDLLKNKSI
jgi:hypothetical protein